ncbi:MAG: HNH endonuclease [Thermoleophilia bacterium]
MGSDRLRDDDVRAACFAALDVLRASFGPDVPVQALREGFNFRGRRTPFLSTGFGIYRARDAQRGPAALSINSSFRQRRYQDEETPDGVFYAYQDGPLDNHFNRWLRAAHALQVPLVYFIGTRTGWYRPEYPVFLADDDPAARRVLVTFGRMVGPMDEREAQPIRDEIERRYVVREVRQRLHQTAFRGAVVPAYLDRCAICSLKEVRLLDAAHILGDADERGDPVVSNGLSLCTIHHRAYDQDLIGISPDREVRVSRRLLDDDDGPMLELLKSAHGRRIALPGRAAHHPDPRRLAVRFDRFLSTG